MTKEKAILALADGTVFEGWAYGARGETTGEVVFNTSMWGYQEILSDPSYNGQIVTMTYPLIGNYGVNEEDFESRSPQVSGFIVKEPSAIVSNWRGTKSLDQLLQEHNIVGIQGIDTRALTSHIRDAGAQSGIISTVDLAPQSLIAKAKAVPGMAGSDLVKNVTCGQKYTWQEGIWNSDGILPQTKIEKPIAPFKVAAYDFGIKHNILRNLVEAGCDVTVYPAQTPCQELLAANPDGIFLSNGPGDPQAVTYAVENVRNLIGIKPIFGICLGHQIIGLALGYDTYKLKFGHRGGNHPVKNLLTGQVEITAQNHGFAVNLPKEQDQPAELTHINLNDQTVEGFRHKTLPLFSVQYHPESSPGPHDSRYLFTQFCRMMEQCKK
ncbi:MAG: glutamine-hydrolyzing carbamoyl-phosphate synthase small subunit [Candidatus Schekmanbacteria bacterium]|nr:glutamine-hydrolyzing carbamoyl-phosphate synthase small subunit [Candidatus Schekmanbacteria bacterium]